MTVPERSANGGIINAQELAVNHKLKKINSLSLHKQRNWHIRVVTLIRQKV